MNPRQRDLALRDRLLAGWKPVLWCATMSCLTLVGVGFSVSVYAADQTDNPNDQLWNLAMQAYRSEQLETGHVRLKNLMDKNPGDLDLGFGQAHGRQNRVPNRIVSGVRRLIPRVGRQAAGRAVNKGQLDLIDVEVAGCLEDECAELLSRVRQAH